MFSLTAESMICDTLFVRMSWVWQYQVNCSLMNAFSHCCLCVYFTSFSRQFYCCMCICVHNKSWPHWFQWSCRVATPHLSASYTSSHICTISFLPLVKEGRGQPLHWNSCRCSPSVLHTHTLTAWSPTQPVVTIMSLSSLLVCCWWYFQMLSLAPWELSFHSLLTICWDICETC